MDNKTIFTKTAKGLGEAVGKTKVLSRELRNILKEIDGKATKEDLLDKLSNVPEEKLENALQKLSEGDFIREFIPLASGDTIFGLTVGGKLEDAQSRFTMDDFLRAATPQSAPANNLDFKSIGLTEKRSAAELAAEAQSRSEEMLRLEQIAREKESQEAKKKAGALALEARRKADAQKPPKPDNDLAAEKEAAERQREAAEKQAQQAVMLQLEKEAEEKLQREAAATAMAEAAEKKAREQAEEQTRRAAEEQARKAAELAQRQARELAEQQAAEQARQEAEKRAQQDAAEKAQRAAEAQAKEVSAAKEALRKAEELTQRHAEDKARREAEAQAKKEAKELAQQRATAEAAERERQAQQQAEEQARLAAAAQAEKEAAEQTRLLAAAERERKEKEQELARQQAEAEAQRAAEENARREAEAAVRAEADAKEARRKAEVQERRRAEDKARREAEAQAKKEAAEQAEREAAQQAQLQAEAEAREREAQRQADLLAQQQAEEAAQRAAEEEAARLAAEAQAAQQAREQLEREQELEQARREAEESAWRAAEELAQKNAEELAQRKAALEAQQQAEEEAAEQERQRKAATRARIEAEEIARREREQLLNAEQAEQSRREALQRAEDSAAEKLRQIEARTAAARTVIETDADDESEADAEPIFKAPLLSGGRDKHYKLPNNLGKMLAIGFVCLTLIGIGWLHLTSFDTQAALFEKAASQQFQQTVKIGQVQLALLPQPHWRLRAVTIGADKQIKIAEVSATPELGSLFSEQMRVKSLALQTVTITEEGLSWLIFGSSKPGNLALSRIDARDIKLDSPRIKLGGFDADADMNENGGWQTMSIDSHDKKLHIQLQPQKENIQLDIAADGFVLPFGVDMMLEKFNAQGSVNQQALIIDKFNSSRYNGLISGNATLKWGDSWRLSGDFSGKQIDSEKIMPTLIQGSKVELTGQYNFEHKDADKLLNQPRLRGNATLQSGTLLGVDFAALLRSPNSSGQSLFNEMSATFSYDANALQVRKVLLRAGLVSAYGSADMAADGRLNGQFVVDLKSQLMQTRAQLALSGTLQQPLFNK